MNPDEVNFEEKEVKSLNSSECDIPSEVIEEIYTDGAIETCIFNEIADLKQEGNDLFHENKFKESIECYKTAVKICAKHRRIIDLSILFSNISLAYQKLDMFEQCLIYCTKALKMDETFVKPLVRRATVFEKLEKLEKAVEDYERLLELNYQPHMTRQKIAELKKKIDEKNEQLKDDMLTKLKQLGNTFLRPFGLSTDNFKACKLAGVPILVNPKFSLMEVYTKMLDLLEKMPQTYSYRKLMVPKVNSYIEICKTKTVQEMEQIHDVIEIESHMFQVKCELDLMRKMLETKDWEPFIQPSPPNQYKWP